MKQPDVAARLTDMSMVETGSTPAQLASFMNEERERWGNVIRTSGAKAAIEFIARCEGCWWRNATVEKVLAAVRTGPSRTEIREYPMPDVPEDAALMKMEVAGICGTDVKLYKTPPTKSPVIMGHENIGIIAKAGREFTRRKGFREGDLVFVEHYVMCGKCEWCHAGQYRHCENTDWRSNPDGIRYGYTSAEKAPHLWGGFAQYVYLPWNAVVHHVPKGVTPELAGLVTPMANGVEWSLFDGGVGYNSTVLIQGPGQQGLSQTVICKQAGASLIIVTGTSKDRARMEVAKALGADHVIDVQKEDPLARIKEITGGKGVDVALDCTAGAGTLPDPARRRGAQAQGRHDRGAGGDEGVPEFPARAGHGEIHHHQERARSQLPGVRARAGAARLEALPAGEGDDAPIRTQGRRPGHQVGRRRGRARRDPCLPHAVAIRRRHRTPPAEIPVLQRTERSWLDCPACGRPTPQRHLYSKNRCDILACKECGLGRSETSEFRSGRLLHGRLFLRAASGRLRRLSGGRAGAAPRVRPYG